MRNTLGSVLVYLLSIGFQSSFSSVSRLFHFVFISLNPFVVLKGFVMSVEFEKVISFVSKLKTFR